MLTIEPIRALKKNLQELCGFLVPWTNALAIAPPNGEKIVQQIFLTMREGMTYVARDDEGRIVGAIGMREQEFWYSDQHYLDNLFFFVAPERRFGDVGVKLMREVKKIGDEKGMLTFVVVTNPDRRARKSAAGLYAQIAGYIPAGYVIKLSGVGDSGDGDHKLE